MRGQMHGEWSNWAWKQKLRVWPLPCLYFVCVACVSGSLLFSEHDQINACTLWQCMVHTVVTRGTAWCNTVVTRGKHTVAVHGAHCGHPWQCTHTVVTRGTARTLWSPVALHAHCGHPWHGAHCGHPWQCMHTVVTRGSARTLRSKISEVLHLAHLIFCWTK